MLNRLIGFSIHLLTASGAALGLLALFCAVDGRFVAMFGWLGVAFIVDAVDGTLARRFKVKETIPEFDGVTLDLVVDFLTYVVTPLVALWRSGLLEPAYAGVACAIVCAASALYFADNRMKTHDLWFRGFPALWNVLVLYLLILRPDPLATLGVVAIAAVLMFVPIAFVHPLRVVRLRPVTLAVTGAWGAAAIAAVDQELVEASFGVKAALVATAGYYLILPLFRERAPAEKSGGFHG
jgi:phosphatidylcholine synthase